MITLNQFQTAEQLNEFASSFIDYENPKLQVFTNEYAYYLSAKKYISLKAEFAREPLTGEQWLAGIAYKNSLYFSGDVRLFVGSRKAFFTEFGFYDYLPSVIHVMLACFEHTGAIKKYGTGHGTAMLVDTKNFTIDQPTFDRIINSISQPVVDSKTLIIDRQLTSPQILAEDLEFYKNLHKESINAISVLHQEISKLQDQNFITAQLTWR
jgi:hypothetical protein